MHPFEDTTRAHLLMLVCVQIVHDFEHGGHTNDFLVACGDKHAITYNDRVSNTGIKQFVLNTHKHSKGAK